MKIALVLTYCHNINDTFDILYYKIDVSCLVSAANVLYLNCHFLEPIAEDPLQEQVGGDFNMDKLTGLCLNPLFKKERPFSLSRHPL